MFGVVAILSFLSLAHSAPNLNKPYKSLFDNTCSHKFPVYSELPHHVRLHTDNRQKRATQNGMKIKVLYHSSVDKLPSWKRDIVTERVVPDAVKYWQNILKVVNSGQTIYLNRKCENNQYFLSPDDPTQYCKNRCVKTTCGEWIVPEEHLEACSTCDETGRNCETKKNRGRGVSNVDFILYVSTEDTDQCLDNVAGQAETVAYAAHCQQEDQLDRPVAGHTNICPTSIKKPQRDIRSLTSTLKHELLHALGFSSSLFAYFRDKNGKPLTPRGDDGKPPINFELQVREWSDRIIKESSRIWSVRTGKMTKKISLMVTPSVVREVRRHFDCPTLEGAELEDQGGDGTALTHWEKRLFQNEAMTGTVHTDNPVYSRMTLALLEDSGWYVPDYDKADFLTWGYKAGCDFATKSCKELMDKASKEGLPSPFCNSLMGSAEKTYCTADKRSVGSCNLVQYKSKLPDVYQNFDEVEGLDDRDVAYVGSSVLLADFCPYVQEFSWLGGGGVGGSDDPRGTRCDARENAPESDSNYAMEAYGPRSRCFLQTSQWQQKSCTMVKQWSRFGSGCYNYECVDGRLNILVRNISYPCYDYGQKVEVQLLKSSNDGEWLHDGQIVCPSCREFCNDCSNEGRTLKDHARFREDLGDCLTKAQEESPENELVGFFNEFGLFG